MQRARESQVPGVVALFFSNFSERCKQLRTHLLHDDILHHFKLVCVDNEDIRKAILGSTTVKIENVPCVLHILPDGNISSYEDEKAFEWIEQFINMTKSPRQNVTEVSKGGMPVSRVDHLIDTSTPVKQSRDSFREKTSYPPVAGSQAKRQQVRVPHRGVETEVPDYESPMSELKRGPKRQPFQAITSDRDIGDFGMQRPTRGEGHQGMRSSLPDVGMTHSPGYDEEQENYAETTTQLLPRSVKMIEDLTDFDTQEDEGTGIDMEEDPSGMGIPRSENIPIAGKDQPMQAPPAANDNSKRGNRKAQEKGTAIKNLAAAMASARESEEKQKESSKQAPLRQERSQARVQPKRTML